MSMEDVFSELDQARDAVEPGIFGQIRHELSMGRATATTAGQILERVLRGLNIVDAKFPDYQTSIDISCEGAASSGRHIGQAILAIGGEPNEKLMRALDGINAAGITGGQIGIAYIEQHTKLLEAIHHAKALGGLLAQIAEGSNGMWEQVDSMEQSWHVSLGAIDEYQAGVGRQ